jgi:histone H3
MAIHHVKQTTQKSTGGKPPHHYLTTKATQEAVQQIGGMKKPHRYRSGTVALWEIRWYQQTTNHPTRKAPFQRLVCKLACKIKSNLQMQSTVLLALQEALEAFLTDVFSDTNLCAIHTKHVTIMRKDMALTCCI